MSEISPDVSLETDAMANSEINPKPNLDIHPETNTFEHIPVLSMAVIEGLVLQGEGNYLDATVGGGGHSEMILTQVKDGHLTALDRDEDALQAAQQRLQKYGDRVNFIHSNFADYDFPVGYFHGILADLGVSSYQLDTQERGFSFRQTADLDMRMDRQQELTAADVVNYWSEKDLVDIFFRYGEENLSRRIARQIVQKRPFQTTTDLANAIASAVPAKYRYGRIHPATRVFQALRIVVNDELKALENFLAKAPTALVPGGKLAIISFHSLEDRIVKHTLRESSLLKVITKKPIVATDEEIKQNPRSRSAKLRIAERIVL